LWAEGRVIVDTAEVGGRLEDRRLESRRLEDRRLEDRRLEDRRLEDRRLEDRRLEDRREDRLLEEDRCICGCNAKNVATATRLCVASKPAGLVLDILTSCAAGLASISFVEAVRVLLNTLTLDNGRSQQLLSRSLDLSLLALSAAASGGCEARIPAVAPVSGYASGTAGAAGVNFVKAGPVFHACLHTNRYCSFRCRVQIGLAGCRSS